jgi:hypothetical protein
MKMHRSVKIFSISRLIVIPFFFIAFSANAVEKKPVITAVTVTNETVIVVDIIGADLTYGAAVPTVTLGGQVLTVDVGSLLDTFISASLPAAFPPGDYVLTVAHSKGDGQYDLTVGAGGVVSFPTGNTRGGTNALVNNTTGAHNTAYGVDALKSNTIGGQNTASGREALISNTTGSNNTASGYQALFSNTTGSNNTASGYQALVSNTTGSNNTASGREALTSNITGGGNTASGWRALRFNTIGGQNTASGLEALESNTTGGQNTASGWGALVSNTTGNRNIAMGYLAGNDYTTGSDNIAIGNSGIAGESATIRIGGAQSRAFISGIRGVATGTSDAVPVLIDSVGQLGTVSSSQRHKEHIEDMAGASDGLLSLRPVTFRYKKAFVDGDKPIQYGLIAEEVAEVFPDLVVYNEDGELETVKYHLLATLLLNEFQKLQQVTVDQAARLATVEMQLAALTSRLAQPVTPVSEVQLASN